MRFALSALLLLAACGGGGGGDTIVAIRFSDGTAAAGFVYVHGYRLGPNTEPKLMAGGVAAGDFDGDGLVDLYAVHGDIGPNLLFRNRGDGTFEEVGAAAGVDLDRTFGCSPVFADYDGDGDLDLFVGGVDFSPPVLFRNRGDGTFEDVTAAAGLAITRQNTIGAAWGDYNGDGYLDLFLCHWVDPPRMNVHEFLWRNNGDGTFTDVSAAAGISAFYATVEDRTFTPIFSDVNGDGLPDLLIVADFGTSRVLHNNGDGTFDDVTGPEITDENGMGSTLGDYDGDGDLDWFVSSIYDPNGVSEGFWGITGNRLYRNRGDGTFDDATDEAGVRKGFWGWGSSFADLDNDGHLDIFHVNGFAPDEYDDDPSRLFHSRGDGTFAEISRAAGIRDDGQGRGIALFDCDGDGDLDIFVANNSQAPRLFRNETGNSKTHLNVRLRGLAPNTQAVGAFIRVTAGGRTQVRELRAGNNYVSQSPVEAWFGLGDATQADEVRIRWPEGDESALQNVAAGQTLVVDHPRRP